jgi:hypothetical protein
MSCIKRGWDEADEIELDAADVLFTTPATGKCVETGDLGLFEKKSGIKR